MPLNLIFILIMMCLFPLSALAEVHNNFSKEANFVIKKNNRIFLIHQSKNGKKSHDVSKHGSQVRGLEGEELIDKERVKKGFLRKTESDGLRKLITNTKYLDGPLIRKTLLLK